MRGAHEVAGNDAATGRVGIVLGIVPRVAAAAAPVGMR